MVTANNINQIAHDGERWVGVGAGGTIIYSTDGLTGDTWTTATSSGVVTTASLLAVAHNGVRWVAVGSAGLVLVSEYPHTGDLWRLASNSGSTTTSQLADVNFTPDL